ncbi:MAG: Uncharacterised protein [Cryomorphaceae bacterium]|nr:MAG: Uncharacterised protein [Cryomorphaceae bacterium]
MMPCSIITYKNAENTNTITSNFVISPSMGLNSSMSLTLPWALGNSGMRIKNKIARTTIAPSSKYTFSQAFGTPSVLKAGNRK